MVGVQNLAGIYNTADKYQGSSANYGTVLQQDVMPIKDEISYYKNNIDSLTSGARRKEIVERCKNNIRVLDSDLAALRSVSPAQAYNIQLQRNIDKQLKIEISNYEEIIKNMTKKMFS